MQQPQYANAEFVTEQIFNTASQQIMYSIREMGANAVFFIAGVVNPSALVFSFNSNLTINVNAPSPFKCLFGTGAYSGAHGIVNGVDSPLYPNVNLTGLVPGVGSVTAYITAIYSPVQLDPVVIIGPPPGHPDYSPAFLPYTAYTRIQDSIAIIATTAVPDNIVSIELARTTLIAGQTQITTVDTSHQVLASVVVNLNGDVTGPGANNFISKLQGKVVSAASPIANQVLQYNGSAWVPVTQILVGDVIGPISSNQIAKIQGNPVIAPSPTSGQVLEYNGASWVPATPAGDITGAPPTTTVIGIEGVPISGPPTVGGQVPTYFATAHNIEWTSSGVLSSATAQRSGSFAVTNVPTSVVNVAIAIPSDGGNYRVQCEFNIQIGTTGGVSSRGGFAYVNDGSMIFGRRTAEFGSPETAILFAGGVNGFTYSPVYAAGAGTITFTLYVALGSGTSGFQVQGGVYTYMTCYLVRSS